MDFTFVRGIVMVPYLVLIMIDNLLKRSMIPMMIVPSCKVIF